MPTDAWAAVPGRPYVTDTYNQAVGITNTLALPDNTSGPTYDGFTNGYNAKMAPFNARGDGVVDDSAAIQAAITAAGVGGEVYVPPGNYLIGTKLSLKPGTRIRGSGSTTTGTNFIPTGTLSALFELDSVTLATACASNALTNFRVTPATGTTIARIFSMIPSVTYLSSELYVGNLFIDNSAAACTGSALYLENVIGGLIERVSFRGNCADAHIEYGSGSVPNSVGNYTLECRSIYSGGNNTTTPYGIKVLGTAAAPHVSAQLNNCTLQNHTTAGIGLYWADNVDINQYYSEVNTRALIAGDWGTLKYVRGLNVNGGRVWSNDLGDKGYLLDYAEHVTINNPRIHELPSDNWVEYGRVNGLLIHLFGQPSDAIHDRVLYNANSEPSTAVTIVGAGNRDASIITNDAPSITLMTTNLGVATARKHYKMQVDNTGAWVATSWVPTVA